MSIRNRICVLRLQMILEIWIVVLFVAAVLYYRQVYSRFTKYGVKQQTPFPLFGNMWRVTLRLEHFTDTMNSMYKEFPEERFIGRFEFIKPCLFVTDIELIKKITVKDFEHFLDRSGFSVEVDPLFSRNLFSLKGQEWKDMRSTLSPAFTSSKIKQMVPFMEEVGEMMIQAVKNKIKNSGSEWIEIDCKDLTTRYTNDVIASCAFGIKVDSHTNVDNDFYKIGKIASTFKTRDVILFQLYSAAPFLGKFFKLELLSTKTRNFFIDLVLSTMKERETHNIIRPDMIHLLMEAKKGRLHHEKDVINADDGFATVEESEVGKNNKHKSWSDTDLIAQAVLFFIAAFEVVSTAMTFTLTELALHPDVKERLALEIKEHNEKYGGKIDLHSIQTLTYLDMVISEVLRLWVPTILIERMCVKDYNMGKSNGEAKEDFILRKGESLHIPTWCIHRDPQFFPNPNKFDPERFSKENRHLIHPIAYMPFGLGPRNCIGSRFALCELKLLVYQILLNFDLSPTKKTCIPARLNKSSFHLQLEGGHALKFRSRYNLIL
nr:cytochrome P450 9e2-like isoform X1 [Danaus plexippus plexippus]